MSPLPNEMTKAVIVSSMERNPLRGGGLTVTVALPARHEHARLKGA